jgi:hypothetical protein
MEPTSGEGPWVSRHRLVFVIEWAGEEIGEPITEVTGRPISYGLGIIDVGIILGRIISPRDAIAGDRWCGDGSCRNQMIGNGGIAGFLCSSNRLTGARGA